MPAPRADNLLAEIAKWCERTGQSEGQLGGMVLNHPGFVPLLRKRGTLTLETAEKLRAFMARYPDGCTVVEGVREVERRAFATKKAAVKKASPDLDAGLSRAKSVLSRTAPALQPKIAQIVPTSAPVVDLMSKSEAAIVDRRARDQAALTDERARLRSGLSASIASAVGPETLGEAIRLVQKRWPSVWNRVATLAADTQMLPGAALLMLIERGLDSEAA